MTLDNCQLGLSGYTSVDIPQAWHILGLIEVYLDFTVVNLGQPNIVYGYRYRKTCLQLRLNPECSTTETS